MGGPRRMITRSGGKKHRFAAENICHIKSFHPQDDHYGFSPMQAAAMAIDVHNSASRWSKSLLDNAARPSGALVWKGDGHGVMAEDQFRRLSDEIEQNYRGARNAGRPMVLEGGLDWKPMGFSPSDMEFQKTKEAAAREIALAFGVPPMLLGIQGDATYSNYQEANRAFYRLTVLPLVTRVAAAVSDWLAGFTGEELVLKPDLDQVPALVGGTRRAMGAGQRGRFPDRCREACLAGAAGACGWLRGIPRSSARRVCVWPRMSGWPRSSMHICAGGLDQIEEMMERLERRLWLTVYGVAAVILAQAFQSLLVVAPRVQWVTWRSSWI